MTDDYRPVGTFPRNTNSINDSVKGALERTSNIKYKEEETMVYWYMHLNDRRRVFEDLDEF